METKTFLVRALPLIILANFAGFVAAGIGLEMCGEILTGWDALKIIGTMFLCVGSGFYSGRTFN